MEIKTNESAKMPANPTKLSKPWQPPKTIEFFNKKSGIRYKWCSKAILEKRIAWGWKVTSKLDSNGKEIGVPHNLSLDSTYQHRGLILCEMPEEMANSRNAYFQREAAALQEGNKNQFRKQASETGTEAYNPKV